MVLEYGAEVEPGEVGADGQKLAALYRLLEKQIADDLEPGLQLTIRKRGKVVFDVAMGLARREDNLPMTRDTLMMIFSATKPLTAMCIHLLAERGQLQLDDKVAQYWPEFARNGKENVTIRHVLTHRGGFPDIIGKSRFHTWEDVVRLVEEAEARFAPGTVVAYHPMNYGWALGELIGRISGRPVAEFMHDELFAPLQMDNSFLGLPESEDYRSSRFHGQTEEQIKGMKFWNLERARRFPMPAANAWTTTGDMTRFYQMMLNGGELDGVQVVKPETVKQALAVSAMDEKDGISRETVRLAHGFILGGKRGSTFGHASTERTFGHDGYQSTTAWADPDRQIACAFFPNQVIGEEKSYRRTLAVNEAVYEACG